MNQPFWTERDAATRAAELVERGAIIDAASTGLTKLEAADPKKTYYRGVDYIAKDHLATHVEGGIITLEGFASTSLSRETAKNFGSNQYLYVIKSRGGNYDVRPISMHASEQEFLYPPNTKFRLTKISTAKDIRRQVFAIEEVPEVGKRDTDTRRRVTKADEDWQDYEGDLLPPGGFEHMTQAQFDAWVRAMEAEDARHVPTAEDLEMGRHFAEKQASASSMNQRDPNAPSDAD
jgi:hypothetical protein